MMAYNRTSSRRHESFPTPEHPPLSCPYAWLLVCPRLHYERMSADTNSGTDFPEGTDIPETGTTTPNVESDFDVRMPSGTDDPLSDAEIQRYREEINRMDRIILDAAKRRQQVSQAIGRTRMSSGGTRLVHTREVQIINQFRDELGEEGPAIASALLRMGRGRLG